jgi:hypothetical protein
MLVPQFGSSLGWPSIHAWYPPILLCFAVVLERAHRLTDTRRTMARSLVAVSGISRRQCQCRRGFAERKYKVCHPKHDTECDRRAADLYYSLRQLTAKKMEELILEFVRVFLERGDAKIRNAVDANVAAREVRKIQVLTSICVGHAIVVSETYIGSTSDSDATSVTSAHDHSGRGRLFERIHSLFHKCARASIFLELLEPFILNDKLSHLNPAVMQALVEHYQRNQWLDRVEQVLPFRMHDTHTYIHTYIHTHTHTYTVWCVNRRSTD